ncbi:flavin-containing monooxygenase [Spirillospora sp. CA-142024]|uniref:flavin-containing monooxygenase n=1 Tax=Spirillospora sp. CA-142024 TaxID=3240036 RepID=UPI003D936DB9
MPQRFDAIIIGGGQAGLATAHVALTLGLRPVLLEASPSTAGSWPHYYESLTLFSPARRSALPGATFPGDPDGYPARDEQGRRYEVVAESGESVAAPIVVSATGAFSRPHRPELPGLSDFTGMVLHSSQYKRPEEFAGQRVIIVGGGNSAVQIAVELAEHARVTLATRNPLRFMPQRVLGIDMHIWLQRTGLDAAGWARPLLTGGKGTPVFDTGSYRAQIATGNPDRRPMFTSLDGGHVVWQDGTRERADVLLATGFRPDSGHLEELAALDRDGQPLHRGGLSSTHPGFGYVGLEWQRSFASATLRGVGTDARYVLTHLLKQTRTGT